MASKAGSRMRNIIQRIPTGAINNPKTNENIKLSVATEVEPKGTKDTNWVRPSDVAKAQGPELYKVIDYNKNQLKPGTVEISQREAQHNSENDPRDHLTCVLRYDDDTTSTEHFLVPKRAERSDDKTTKKSSDKKSEKTGKKK